MFDISTLKVGDRVSVARRGSWRTCSDGVYTVVKANKVKIVVGRELDKYQREFSVKKNRELGTQTSTLYTAFLESIDSMQERAEADNRERARAELWKRAERAAANKDIRALRAVVAEMESA